MVPQRLLVGAAIAFAISVGIRAQPDFKPKDQLPPQLRDIAEDHTLDKTCDMDGDATNPRNKLQNEAKNNFYITDEPVTITYNTFIRLMKAAEDQGIPHGSDKSLPADRSILKDFLSDRGVMLGEGTMVRFVAQIIEARHSNKDKGESVN